jgi:hypothetical protein
MPRVDATAALAEKMVQELRRRRGQGGDAYPARLSQLAGLTEPPALAPTLRKALKKKPFAAEMVAAANHPDAPLALVEDRERLAASPLLLEFALGLLCKPGKEVHPVTRLLTKVDKSLRPDFEAVLQRHLAEDSLPATVGRLTVRNKVQLYLRRLPPPPPPHVTLAEKLVRALEGQYGQAGAPEFPTLKRLLQGADPAAKATVVKKALAEPIFRDRVVLALPRQPDSPLALSIDGARLAASAVLLETALDAVRTPQHQAVSLTDLKKKVVPALQQPFTASVARRLESDTLPPGVGCLRIKKTAHLFRLADVQASAAAAAPAPLSTATAPVTPSAVLAVDFARQFEEAFDRLDRRKGSHNLVSLVDLRPALPVDRAAFDAGLLRLRREGRFSLSNAEGRHGLGPAEHAAGIVEEGNLLLYVSRKGI